ncbi:DUF6292 family protein [Actinomadura nitritigenes]|uniref:DUF6292 family protein n=1 Tax=Actinomadura nitritigenes TaxID=134602 RepID=UPI003D9404E7
MKLTDLRALPEGASLLAGGRPATLAGLVPPAAPRRLTRVRVVQDGAERIVPPNHLTDPYPPVAGDRGDLGGHTITIERLDAVTARRYYGWTRDPGREAAEVAGCLAVVERTDGRLGTVCCIEQELWPGVSLEESARSYAGDYGARYVPPFQLEPDGPDASPLLAYLDAVVDALMLIGVGVRDHEAGDGRGGPSLGIELDPLDSGRTPVMAWTPRAGWRLAVRQGEDLAARSINYVGIEAVPHPDIVAAIALRWRTAPDRLALAAQPSFGDIPRADLDALLAERAGR